jgi:hypothetical protein
MAPMGLTMATRVIKIFVYSVKSIIIGVPCGRGWNGTNAPPSPQGV